MKTPTLAAALVAALLLGGRQSAQGTEQPALLLKEERMTLEYTATAGEAVVLVTAESEEPIGRVEVRDPGGASVMSLWAGRGQRLALQGFVVEVREASPASILETYPEGEYELRGWTTDGRPAHGRARLVHDLLDAPLVLFPADGAEGVEPMFTVTWVPDPQARGYRVILEQNENDGLSVELPGRSNSFRVPEDVLRSGELTHLEVGAIGSSGNTTLVELTFTTR